MKQKFEILLVGGAVRDKLLGLEVKDHDWLAVGATPEYFINQNYKEAGKDFPVFLHPETGDEYALARTERKVGHGYNGFEASFDPTVSVEDDLFRRDLTINAMAERDNGEIVDPFNGMKDIQNKVLRHVSKHFAEDPVRVLRVSRFMARYSSLGFKVHEDTIQMMREMVDNGELNHLTSERVFKELEKVFDEPTPSAFFQTMRDCGALKIVFPEVDQLFGVKQPKEHHPEIDTGIHTLMVLDQAKKISNGDHAIMYAALTHDLGKGITPKEILPKHLGHETAGLKLVKAMNERLKVPSFFKNLALLNCEFHTKCHRALDMNPPKIHELFKSFDAYRRDSLFKSFLKACEADARGRTGFENRDYPQPQFLLQCLEAAQQVNAKEFLEKGLKGKEIGEAVEAQRKHVINIEAKFAEHKIEPLKEKWRDFFNNFDNLSNEEVYKGFKQLNIKHDTLIVEKLMEHLEVKNQNIINIAKDLNAIDPQKYLDEGLVNQAIGLAIENEKIEIIENYRKKPKRKLKRN